jgi:hypothetical protein
MGGEVLEMGGNRGPSLAGYALHYLGLVVCLRFPPCHGDGTMGAFANAGTESVTQALSHEASLSIDDPERPFGTARRAGAATIALVLVDLDYFPKTHGLSLIGPDVSNLAAMLPL